MTPALLEQKELEYEIILAMDDKLQVYLKQLPVYFRLDPASIKESEHVSQQRPNIAWQKLTVNFSVHSRLCRLHRPYHLDGSTNPRYAYSRTVCIRSAQKVLELRRLMDDITPSMNPSRFWVIMQHVYMAALVLATDASFHSDGPDAEDKKAKVMAAYKILEKSKGESNVLWEGIQRNMQNLLKILQQPRQEMLVSHSDELEPHNPAVADNGAIEYDMLGSSARLFEDTPQANRESSITSNYDGWDRVWSDFLDAAPDLDPSHWTSLFDGIPSL
jgi:hypothetical protein